MAPIDKSLKHGSQVVMRCSLQMVYKWTEELFLHTNGTNRKLSLTNGDFFELYQSFIDCKLHVRLKHLLKRLRYYKVQEWLKLVQFNLIVYT